MVPASQIKLSFNPLISIGRTHLNLGHKLHRNAIHELFAARAQGLVLSSNQKVTKRIFQNIIDELRKHNDAHRYLEKMRFGKESAVITRNISRPNKV